MDLAWTYILAFHFGLRVEPAAAFKLSSSPRRAAHASHSCERRPTRTAVQIEQRGDASIPGGLPRDASIPRRNVSSTRQPHNKTMAALQQEWVASPSSINCIALGSSIVATGGQERRCCVWRLKDAEHLAVLRGQHVVDNLSAPGPRRDPCVERLRRWLLQESTI